VYVETNSSKNYKVTLTDLEEAKSIKAVIYKRTFIGVFFLSAILPYYW